MYAKSVGIVITIPLYTINLHKITKSYMLPESKPFH